MWVAILPPEIRTRIGLKLQNRRLKLNTRKKNKNIGKTDNEEIKPFYTVTLTEILIYHGWHKYILAWKQEARRDISACLICEASWKCNLPSSLLEFSQPWVSNGCSQDGSEVTEAAEGMVHRCGSVFTPMQEIQEIQGQHS